MNKFKKILLGTLSVLTLGLFVATGARVDAADNVFTFDLNESENSMVGDSGTSKTYSSTVGELIQALKCTNNTGIKIEGGNPLSIKTTTSDGTNGNTIDFEIAPLKNGTITFSADARATNKYWNFNCYENDKLTLDSPKSVNTNGMSTISFDLKKDNTYIIKADYVGKATARFSPNVTFTPDPEETVTALQQEAIVGDYTLVRFIFIISNATAIDSYDFTDVLHLCLDAEKTDGPVVHRTPNVYTKLTSNGKAYSAEVKGNQYTFDNSVNENDVYVVYIVKFTTAKYQGHNISADLEYKAGTYSTTPYTFE